MRKMMLGVLAALALATAGFAVPAHAQSRCWWNGYGWQCVHRDHDWWRWHYRHHWHHYRDWDDWDNG